MEDPRDAARRRESIEMWILADVERSILLQMARLRGPHHVVRDSRGRLRPIVKQESSK